MATTYQNALYCSANRLKDVISVDSEYTTLMETEDDLSIRECLECLLCGCCKPRIPVDIRNAQWQMEGIVSQLAGTALDMLPDAAQAVGKMAKGLFREPGNKDQPSVIDDDKGDVAMVNVPTRASSTALRWDDKAGDHGEVVDSDDTLANEHLLRRLKVLSRLSTVVWSTQAVGDVLFQCVVTPNMCGRTNTSTIYTMRNTALSYYAMLYDYWRGSLKFTVECIPSRFHQGQLFLAFTPRPGTPTMANCKSCLCATIELGINNRTTFEIPYVTTRDWLLNTDTPVNIGSSYQYDTAAHNAIGTFFVFVQNPLDYTTAVASDIEVNIYISAGDDFKFASPRSLTLDTGKTVKIYVGGSWQMEVTNNDITDPHSQTQIALHSKSKTNAAVVANVETATTENVLGRSYLLQTNISWSTTTTVGTDVTTIDLPTAFYGLDLAPSGMFSYHEFLRCGFRIKLRLNPTIFHQGALLMFWAPMNILGTDVGAANRNIDTFMQYPHVLLNASTESCATLEVPYTQTERMVRVGGGVKIGTVHVVVWNLLKAPASAPTTLKLATWIEAIDPLLMVKRPRFTFTAVQDAVPQMEYVSDSARGAVPPSSTFPKLTIDRPGHTMGDHMNVLDLLRRKCWLTTKEIPKSLAAQDKSLSNVVAQFPAFCGKEHLYVLQTYMSYSGTNKFTMMSTVHRAQDVRAFFRVQFSKYTAPVVEIPNPPANMTMMLAALYDGAVCWHMCRDHEKVVEIPYYQQTPMLSSPLVNAGSPGDKPVLCTLATINYDVLPNLQVLLFHHVADDFHVYFPVGIPLTQIEIPTLEFEEDPFVDLLLEQGIEPNPGPEKVKEVIAEAQMFGMTDAVKSVGETCNNVNEFIGGGRGEVLSTSIIHAAKEMTGVAARVNTMLDAVDTNHFKTVVEDVGRVSNTVTTEMERVSQLFRGSGQAESWVKLMTSVLDVTQHIIGLFKGGVSRALAMVALGARLPVRWYKLIEKKLEDLQLMQPQGGGKSLSSLVTCIVPIVFHTVAHSLGRIVADDFVGCVIDRVKQIAHGSESLWQKVASSIVEALQWFCDKTGMFATWYAESRQNLDEFMDVCTLSMSTGAWTDSKIRQGNNRRNLRIMVERARNILKYAPNVPRMSTTYARMATKVLDLAPLLKEDQPIRVEPVVLHLAGESQIGKSFLCANAIPYLLLKKSGLCKTFRECKEEVYCEPTDENVQYYEGYRNQLVFYKDDFLKSCTPLDAERLINQINSSSCYLNRAAIADKGQLFMSPFVVTSSNTSMPCSIIGIRHIEAVQNRLHFPYWIKCRRTASVMRRPFEDLKRIFDSLVKEEDMYTFIRTHWSFHQISKDGSYAQEETGFERIISNVVMEYHRRVKSRANLDTCWERFDGYRPVVEEEVAAKEITPQEVRDIRADLLIRKEGLKYADVVAVPQGDDLEEEFHDTLEPESDIKPYLDVEEVESFITEVLETDRFEEVRDIELHGQLKDVDVSLGTYYDLRDRSNWSKLKTLNDIKACYLGQSNMLKMWTGLKPYLLGLGMAAAVVTLLVTYIPMLLRLLIRSTVGDSQGSYDDTKLQHAKPRATPKKDGIFQGLGQIQTKIQRNIRPIEIVDVEMDKTMTRMYALFLEGKRALIPRHFWEYLQKVKSKGVVVPSIRIGVYRPDGEMTWRVVKMNQINVVPLKSDLGLLDCVCADFTGAHLDPAARIRDFIPTVREFNATLKDREIAATLMSVDGNTDLDVHLGTRGDVAMVNQLSSRKETYAMVMSKPLGSITKSGDCGRPYILKDPRCKPLAAMHCAMTADGTGWATALIYEEVAAAYEKLDRIMEHSPVALEVEAVMQGDGVKPEYWNTDIVNIGKVELKGCPIGVYSPLSTKYRPWMQHEDWERIYAPSAKTRGKGIDPLISNAQKAIVNDAYVAFEWQHMCVKHYANKFPKQQLEPFSDGEMINGRLPMVPIEMHTSCGYMSKYFKNGKKELFEVIEGREGEVHHYKWSSKAGDFVIPEYGMPFRVRLLECDRLLSEGVVPTMLWTASVKDELRTIVKVEERKSRVFEMAPLEHTLLVRRYFGDLMNWIKSQPGFFTHSGVGADKEEIWPVYWHGLHEVGTQGFDIDYSGYDGSVVPMFYDMFGMLCDEFYGPRDRLQRWGLLHCMQYATVVVGDTVMVTEQGNKSGCAMTDIFNTVVNVFIQYLSYLHGMAVHTRSPPNLKNFDRDVRFVAYGDDVIAAADIQTLQFYNRLTVAEFAGALGMRVTPAHKDDTLVPYEALRDISFLKSEFKESWDLVLAPPPKSTSRRILQWISKTNVHDLRAQQNNIQVALRFEAHRGKEEVETLQKQLLELGVDTTFDYGEFVMSLREKQKPA